MNKIKYGYCHCGCGKKTSIAIQTDNHRGNVKGEPVRFLSGHNARLNFGKDAPGWRGGRTIVKKKYTSYMKIHKPGHSRSSTKGYVYEHILVVEKALGFSIGKEAVVHHIDKNGLNNELSNLMVFKNSAEHARFHNLHRT